MKNGYWWKTIIDKNWLPNNSIIDKNRLCIKLFFFLFTPKQFFLSYFTFYFLHFHLNVAIYVYLYYMTFFIYILDIADNLTWKLFISFVHCSWQKKEQTAEKRQFVFETKGKKKTVEMKCEEQKQIKLG